MEEKSVRPFVSIIRSKPKLLALLIILLPVLSVTIDNTILSFSLPQITYTLSPSAAQQLWIIDAYALVLASLLVTMGGFGDRKGHKNVLFIGSLGFSIVSFLIIFSQNAGHIIAGRAALGFFGAMILPATLALIRSTFLDREERRLVVAAWATCLTIGSSIGPVVGGVLLTFFSWHSIFLIAIPFFIPVILLIRNFIHESTEKLTGKIDFLSIGISFIAMFGIMFGLKQVATGGEWPLTFLSIFIGVIFGFLFVKRQLVLPNPLLDMSLFRNTSFSSLVFINMISLGSLIGFIFFATQLLQISHGISPLVSSLILAPGELLAIVSGIAIVAIAQKVKPNFIISGSLILIAISFLAVYSLTLTPLIIGLSFLFINSGVGIIATVSNDLIISSVIPEKAGGASSVSETAYEVGVVLGTTLIGGAITWWYRKSFLLPNYLNDEISEGSADTLAGALSVSNSLPKDIANDLLNIANSAFLTGVEYTSLAAFCFVLLTAILSFFFIKEENPSNN
ncbi:MFS transporter [Bacillus cereus]|uniref:MFS transporter n=1 Tax=Bacillus cereus TaxID=1396 RepID=UPI0040551C6A